MGILPIYSQLKKSPNMGLFDLRQLRRECSSGLKYLVYKLQALIQLS